MAESESGVTRTHRIYDEFQNQWQRLRDGFAGKDAVKDRTRRERYLPRLEGQTEEFEGDYEGYIERALWVGFTDRTLTGLVGAVFRKDPTWDFPDALASWMDDITQTNQSVIDFARMCFREAVGINWAGILVDLPPATDPETGEETPIDERRPTARLYRAEQIRNWRIGHHNGTPTLTQLVLDEIVEEPDADGFGTDEIPQFRVLELKDTTFIQDNGETVTRLAYTQQLWREEEDTDHKKKWIPFGPLMMPNRQDEPLDLIPFVPVSADGSDFQIRTSKLLDVVDINYDHYRLDADHKHGLHFTALPTAWIAGFKTEGQEYRIGSQTAWVTENPDAQAGFLEFSGAGLGAIVTAKESDERMMAVLGARLLEEQKRAVEAAETVRLRQGGEESVLKTAARAVSASLERTLWIMAWWGGGLENPEVSFQLNTDIIATQMSPQMITTLLGALQADKISEQTFLEALVTGEIIQGRTWEEEQDLIELTTLPEIDTEEAA